ncbi:hypothetical protein AZA_90500 [Nitrospirillum viridazoti Y2]|nr:hypothetical protein AZA_90500 [Nitrospirillum amazonense Y2]
MGGDVRLRRGGRLHPSCGDGVRPGAQGQGGAQPRADRRGAGGQGSYAAADRGARPGGERGRRRHPAVAEADRGRPVGIHGSG